MTPRRPAAYADMFAVLNKVPEHAFNAQASDFLIITTKNIPDFGPSLVDVVRPAVGNRTSIVLLQNG